MALAFVLALAGCEEATDPVDLANERLAALRTADDCRPEIPGNQGCSDGGCGCYGDLDVTAVSKWIAERIIESCGASGVASFDGWELKCRDGSTALFGVTYHQFTGSPDDRESIPDPS